MVVLSTWSTVVETRKRESPEIHISEVSDRVPCRASCPGQRDVDPRFVQCLHAVPGPHPSATDEPIQVSNGLRWYHGACVQVTLILLSNGPPKGKSRDAGDLGVPERSR